MNALPATSVGTPLRISVIVPTRNEAANVGPLMQRLSAALEGIPHEVIFIDDSDDGTPHQLEEMAAAEYPEIRLRHRPAGQREGGLSGAVTGGIEMAGSTYIAVLDADLQHPPELLAELLQRAESGSYDIVIASRYVRGGSAAGLGGRFRRLVSLGTAALARILFHERIWGVHDPGSGFFVLRRELVDGLELRPIGYKILLEILIRSGWQTCSELPYVFAARHDGDSKATFRQGVLYLKHLLRLFLEVPTSGRFWKFSIVGTTGLLEVTAMLWLLHLQLGLERTPAWAIATELSILSNFTLNRWFTWRDAAAGRGAGLLAQLARYHGAVFLGLVTNYTAFWLLSSAGVPVLLAGIAGALSGAGVNFLGCQRFVFGGAARRLIVGSGGKP